MRELPRNLTRSALLLLALTASVPLAAQGRAVPDSIALRGTRVEVSRREVRVIFPREMSRAIEETADGGVPEYFWMMRSEGVDNAYSLLLSVDSADVAASGVRSLDSLVAREKAALCRGVGWGMSCGREGSRAWVDGEGRVTLAFADSAVVARWFGHQPRRVHVRWRGPGAPSYTNAETRVRYVAPGLPPATPEIRAAAEASRDHRERSIRRIARYIQGEGESDGGVALLLAVGDSVRVYAGEHDCIHDFCFSSGWIPNSGWSVDDTLVARVRPEDSRERTLVALREGRTQLRVTGLRGDSDTARTLKPPQREAAREVVVTSAPARVEVKVPADTVRVGQGVQLDAWAIDRDGRRTDGAFVRLEIVTEGERRVLRGRRGQWDWNPEKPGRYVVTGSMGGVTGTAVMHVLPAQAPTP